MKKKSGSRVGRFLKNKFKVRSWIDFDRIRQGGDVIVSGWRTYFIPQEKTATESFEEAKARLNLTDDDLLVRQKGLFRLVIIMVSMAMMLFLYFLYNLFYGRYAAVLLSSIVMLLALVIAFRYHFWYFQIQQRKLGCTLSDWFWQGLMGVSKDE